MQLSLYSEIGRLREVLVHAPGREVDVMPPSMMAELLFDDILQGSRARSEHRAFRAILERFGARTWDTQDLLVEALAAAPDRVAELLGEVCDLEGLSPSLREELQGLPPVDLAAALVHGVPAPPDELEPDYLFRMRPLPNLLFSRDAQVVLAHGVVIGAMSRAARQREPLLSRFVFRHHPRLGDAPILADYTRRRREAAWPHNAIPTLEGGDVLVFHEGVVVVGVSERTMEPAVDRLVATLRALDRFRSVVMVPMPRTRHAMHLDTIFTRTSEDECLVYAPMILPGSPESLSAIRIDLTREGDWGVRRPSLLDALREVGVDLAPICCGGPDDYIQQTREQWTDGANSFALAPGVVLLYGRNARTAEELERKGYHPVRTTDMDFAPDGRCLYDFTPGKRYAVLVAGEELSRARGGPRCMTMPLVRDPV